MESKYRKKAVKSKYDLIHNYFFHRHIHTLYLDTHRLIIIGLDICQFEIILNVRYSHHCLLSQWTPLPSRIRHRSSQEGPLRCRTRHQFISDPCSWGSGVVTQKKAVTKLQDGKTVKKIVQLDNHIHMAYSGLTADGRILANKARIECQSYRLNYDDNPPV